MTFKYTMKSHHGIAKFGNDPELHRRPEPESANNNLLKRNGDGVAGDLTLVRPAAAASPRRPEQVEQHRAA